MVTIIAEKVNFADILCIVSHCMRIVKTLILVFFLLPSAGLFSQERTLDVSTRHISDDSALRMSLMDTWFTEPPRRTLDRKPELFRLSGGDQIEVRSEAGRDEVMVILARGRNGRYRGYIQGSWILNRNLSDGRPNRIRIFLRSDPYTYIQFRPLGDDRSQMDMVLYEGMVIQSLPLAIPFQRLLVERTEDVLKSLEEKFPRRYFDPPLDSYRDVRSLVASVRKELPALSFVDDGAIDENGNYVFINTLLPQNSDSSPGGLNCSGFVKWLVDGLLKPVTGSRLAIPPLKEPAGDRGSAFTEPFEASRDPFFGLDWTRNLALKAISVLRSPSYKTLHEIEVRDDKTATVIIRKEGQSSQRPYQGYLLNAGFGIEGLHSLLYTLAIDEPGCLYLAAVNAEMGRNPRIRQYFHVAALVPYFTEQGAFQVAVFESAAETSFTAFKNRYPLHSVNLVRIPIEAAFDP